MCEIKRISSRSQGPQAPDFKITLNIAGDTEVIEVAKTTMKVLDPGLERSCVTGANSS